MTAALYLPFASFAFIWSGALFSGGCIAGWYVRGERDKGAA